MNSRTILQKLKSTKLWCAIIGIVTGLAIAFGADASDIQTVSGAATAVISLVTYIITEGKIDAKAVGETVQVVKDAYTAVVTDAEEVDKCD